MILNLISGFKKLKIVNIFLNIMGDNAYSYKKKSVSPYSFSQYNKVVKYLVEKEKDIIKKKNFNSFDNILIQVIKAKIAFNMQDYNLCSKILTSSRSLLFNNRSLLTDVMYDMVWLSVETISCDCAISIWTKEIEVRKKHIEETKKINNDVLLSLKMRLLKIEINSEKYLELNRIYIAKKLSFNKEIISLEEGCYQNAISSSYTLISQIDNLLNKFKLSKFIFFNENGVDKKQSSTFLLNMYSVALLLKLKLSYYTEQEQETLFYMVNEIIKLQISLYNENPLAFLLSENNSKEISYVLNLNREDSFKNYLLTFHLSIYKISVAEVFTRLQQFQNYQAQSIEKAVSLYKVKDKKEYELLKQKHILQDRERFK